MTSQTTTLQDILKQIASGDEIDVLKETDYMDPGVTKNLKLTDKNFNFLREQFKNVQQLRQGAGLFSIITLALDGNNKRGFEKHSNMVGVIHSAYKRLEKLAIQSSSQDDSWDFFDKFSEMIERVGETPGKTHLTFCQVFMQTTFRTTCQDKLAFDFRKMAADNCSIIIDQNSPKHKAFLKNNIKELGKSLAHAGDFLFQGSILTVTFIARDLFESEKERHKLVLDFAKGVSQKHHAKIAKIIEKNLSAENIYERALVILNFINKLLDTGVTPFRAVEVSFQNRLHEKDVWVNFGAFGVTLTTAEFKIFNIQLKEITRTSANRESSTLTIQSDVPVENINPSAGEETWGNEVVIRFEESDADDAFRFLPSMEENDEEADQAEQGAGHRKASIADSRAFIAMKESEQQRYLGDLAQGEDSIQEPSQREEEKTFTPHRKRLPLTLVKGTPKTPRRMLDVHTVRVDEHKEESERSNGSDVRKSHKRKQKKDQDLSPEENPSQPDDVENIQLEPILNNFEFVEEVEDVSKAAKSQDDEEWKPAGKKLKSKRKPSRKKAKPEKGKQATKAKKPPTKKKKVAAKPASTRRSSRRQVHVVEEEKQLDERQDEQQDEQQEEREVRRSRSASLESEYRALSVFDDENRSDEEAVKEVEVAAVSPPSAKVSKKRTLYEEVFDLSSGKPNVKSTEHRAKRQRKSKNVEPTQLEFREEDMGSELYESDALRRQMRTYMQKIGQRRDHHCTRALDRARKRVITAMNTVTSQTKDSSVDLMEKQKNATLKISEGIKDWSRRMTDVSEGHKSKIQAGSRKLKMAWKEAIKFKKQVEADDKHLEAQWKKILETIEVQAQNGFRSVTQSVLSAKEDNRSKQRELSRLLASSF